MDNYLVTYSYHGKNGLGNGFGESEFIDVEKLTISCINEMRSMIIKEYDYKSVVFLNIIKIDKED